MDEAQLRDIETVKILKEQERKLHFFMVTLALGVLSFSIQMFDTVKPHQYVLVIILSWLSLLVSTLAGIFQIQWRLAVEVQQRHLSAKQRDYERVQMASNKLANIVESGNLKQCSPEEIKKMGENYENAIKTMTEDIAKRSQEVYIRAKIHEWALVIGLILLAFFKILNTAP